MFVFHIRLKKKLAVLSVGIVILCAVETAGSAETTLKSGTSLFPTIEKLANGCYSTSIEATPRTVDIAASQSGTSSSKYRYELLRFARAQWKNGNLEGSRKTLRSVLDMYDSANLVGDEHEAEANALESILAIHCGDFQAACSAGGTAYSLVAESGKSADNKALATELSMICARADRAQLVDNILDEAFPDPKDPEKHMHQKLVQLDGLAEAYFRVARFVDVNRTYYYDKCLKNVDHSLEIRERMTTPKKNIASTLRARSIVLKLEGRNDDARAALAKANALMPESILRPGDSIRDCSFVEKLELPE